MATEKSDPRPGHLEPPRSGITAECYAWESDDIRSPRQRHRDAVGRGDCGAGATVGPGRLWGGTNAGPINGDHACFMS